MSSSSSQTLQDDHSTILTLPLYSGPLSPEHPGMATPPLYTTSASIPFTWEEEPGKPRPPSSPLPPNTTSNILELPPGLARTPSPTTVLDGPYNIHSSSISSSFRFLNDEECLDSGKKKVRRKRLFFASWRHRNSRNWKKEMVGSSCRNFMFPSTSETDSATGLGFGFGLKFDEATSDKSVKFSRTSRNGSHHSVSHKPQFWVSPHIVQLLQFLESTLYNFNLKLTK
ncbi:hypothetical protein LIER_36550 [Lithospermum erythrorhizon]|uniref:Uncharacterized protein n=1 Tax=Lithospermum erythrorhizon TaxID=34254 RepID=A0AAV3P7F1_LITER